MNDRNSFLTVLGTGSRRSGCQCGQALGEGLFPSVQTAVLTLHLQMEEGARELSGVSYKSTDPIHEDFTLMT